MVTFFAQLFLTGFATSRATITAGLTPNPVLPPLGLYAKYIDSQTARVTVSFAPVNASINGCSILVLNETTGVAVAYNVTIYDTAGNTIYNGSGANITGATKSYWQAGYTIRITLSGSNYLSVGDNVEITGPGFGTSKCIISS
jgi:hypothetical protein